MAYDIAEAFSAIEEELIASMIRNLKRHRAEETAEGYKWEQWQVSQLAALEEYRRRNRTKFSKDFSQIHKTVGNLINAARNDGNMQQEERILEAIRDGADLKRTDQQMTAQFFKTNDRKMNALITATQSDFKQAERAMLRQADDQYRKIIFNSMVYANSGAGTYEKAVDMATKDFLKAGIQCIEYKNGSRHTVRDYADMAIKTATKRAYLTGEGEKRKEWGVDLVIINKRTDACPKCLPFQGKVMIDDVWSGGKPDGKHMLISTAMSKGLYHPRCRDSHSTYFPGVSTAPDKGWTKEELEALEKDEKKREKLIYAENQAEKYDRLAEHSLDSENRKKYESRAKGWQQIADGLNSGPVMTGLNAPAITNSDDIVDAFMESIELPEDADVIECVKNSVRHMPEEDLAMISNTGLMIKKTQGANSFNGSEKEVGADGLLKYVIEINPYTDESFVFAHECAHLAEMINDLYHDPEFRAVLENFWDSIYADARCEVGGKCYYMGLSDLLVEPYQGRTYILDRGIDGLEHPVKIEDFVEYISDGYECFVGDPQLLETKDQKLYNYFRRRGLR